MMVSINNPSGGGGGGTATVSPATANDYGTVKLAGALGGTADAPTVPGLAGKANDPHGHPAYEDYVVSVNSVLPDPDTGNVSISTADLTGSYRDTKPAAQSVSDTTLVDDTDLRFSGLTGQKYDVSILLHYDGAVNGDANGDGDLKLSLRAPNGSTVFGEVGGLSSGAAGINSSRLTASIRNLTDTYSLGTIGAGTALPALVTFEITFGADGECVLQWAQRIANAVTPTRVLDGSSIVAVRQ